MRIIFAPKFCEMKIWIGFITVFLFLSSIIRPVLPVYEYLLNYDYIVNVLCINKDKPEMHCDGKCYLKNEISKSNNLDNSSKKALANYQFKPVPVYFETTSESMWIFIYDEMNENILFKVNSFDNVLIEINPPPPRV